MTTSPVFSVVMPMYNVEKFVRQAIDSVLAQTYPNLELICVDDGCTDNTVAIVRSYADPRIRLVQQQNKGLAAARNYGIHHAKGLYVALLDSDDFWHEEKLIHHLQHFCYNPKLGISYSASQFVDIDGVDMGIGQYPKISNITPQTIFCRNPIGNGSAAVIRRSLLTQVAKAENFNGELRLTYFDESMRQSEDVEFWLRVALTTHCVFEGISKPLTYYRVNAGGLSANLINQFNAWHYSVKKNWRLNPLFFKKWYPLAAAYQKRYLARRAIQSRAPFTALRLVISAMFTDCRILIEEPSRTLLTFSCSLLTFLPKKLYDPLERLAMAFVKSTH